MIRRFSGVRSANRRTLGAAGSGFVSFFISATPTGSPDTGLCPVPGHEKAATQQPRPSYAAVSM
jgi:hypothetical protein